MTINDSTQSNVECEHVLSVKLNSKMLASVEELRRKWGLSSQGEAVERLLALVLSLE